MIAALLAGACGDNLTAPKDAAPAEDAPSSDAGPQSIFPCLERPTDLPRVPTGQLPCELLPPGFIPGGHTL
ncbi:MAG: hypothetical protein JWP01_2685 [Myxococcales bacterium]|nr:hypothetical protein [Myxococcales bacterium]